MSEAPALFDPSQEPALAPRKLLPEAADRDPVARVWIEAAVPQLDRMFDYVVPESLTQEAIPGAKVRVVFAGQQINGWIIERRAVPATDHALRPIKRVLSPHPILSEAQLTLFRTVADRQMGMVSDVFRLAIPPRVAGVDSAFLESAANEIAPRLVRSAIQMPDGPAAMGRQRLSETAAGHSFLADLAGGGSPRAVAVLPRGQVDCLLEALSACFSSGRRALVVVPDQRRLEQLGAALTESLGSDTGYVRLSAEDAPTPRYRAFLRTVYGRVDLVVGTRAACYAPVEELGLVALWDDGDSSLVERRAPYAHTRDVLIARSLLAGCGFLIAGQSATTEAMRLADIGWAQLIEAKPAIGRRPRVISSGSEFEAARDRLAQAARIPSVAFQTAQRALGRGPVLVQVARTGYSPVVKCRTCSERALCSTCQGPLIVTARGGEKVLQCSWCSRVQSEFECAFCGGTTLYQPVAGALRTAEELGRAFPGVSVIASSGDRMRESVTDEPALVVATPGAEPPVLDSFGVEQGYAAALLLDADSILARDSLHATEDALRRWFAALSLVRTDGEAVVTVTETGAMNAVVSYDPVPLVRRDYRQRLDVGLPPALRAVTLTGSEAAVQQFWAKVRAELDLNGPLAREPRVIGPALLESEPGEDERHRLLVLFTYQDASRISAAIRARRILESSAGAKGSKVLIHSDPPEID